MAIDRQGTGEGARLLCNQRNIRSILKWWRDDKHCEVTEDPTRSMLISVFCYINHIRAGQNDLKINLFSF